VLHTTLKFIRNYTQIIWHLSFSRGTSAN